MKSEFELAKNVAVNNEDSIKQGIDEGFKGTVNADHLEQKIENTADIIGAAMEGEDLDDLVAKVNKKISRTKVATIAIWILCFITFIARFVLN